MTCYTQGKSNKNHSNFSSAEILTPDEPHENGPHQQSLKRRITPLFRSFSEEL